MKKFVLFLALSAVACRGSEVLDPAGWDPDVHHALSTLIRDGGSASCAPYAVFDCDNTSIIHDVSQNLTLYQIEHLCFGEEAKRDFLPAIEDPSVRLGAPWEMTAAEAGALLAEQYRSLVALRDGGMSLEEIHTQELYLDFRARFLSFEDALGEAVGYGPMCLWQPGLLAGMTTSEARSLIDEFLHAGLAEGPSQIRWTSPDGRFSGETDRGIAVPESMKNLHRALVEHGIDTYICSASLELIVEALACDPEIGFGMPPERVWGIRFAEGDVIHPVALEGYPQPYREGKVHCIEQFIAPGHCGDGPVLVAGDSNGDVAMLTAFRGTRCSLIMDCGRDGKIAELAAKARSAHNHGRFIVQAVNPVSF